MYRDVLSAALGRAIFGCYPGVAELADALDSKSTALHLLKPAHRYSAKHKVYQRGESRIFKLALLCSLLLIVGLQISESPAHAQERKTYTVPFQTVRSLMLVTVNVDGNPKTLIFDTGAERTLLNSRDGNVERSVTFVLGSKVMGNLPIILANLSGMGMEKVKADGVLGQDVLRQFASTRIDYKTQTVTLEQ